MAAVRRRVPQRAYSAKRDGNSQGAWTAREDCMSRRAAAIPAPDVLP